MTINDIQL